MLSEGIKPLKHHKSPLVYPPLDAEPQSLSTQCSQKLNPFQQGDELGAVSFQDLHNTPAHMSFRRIRMLNMSWIHIFTTIWFTFMSLSPVGKPELPPLPSAYQHAELWASQQAQLSRKLLRILCPGCDPYPDTHCICSWPPPCDPPKCTWILCPLKIPQWEHIRGCLNWRQLCGKRQRPTGISCEKPAKGSWCQPGAQSHLTLPSPLLAFLYAILLLYAYLKGDLHCRAPQLCSIATELQQAVFQLVQYGYCIHWNEVCFETKLLSGEVLSSFERDKQAWHQLSSL